MGENILRCEPVNGPPQEPERSTARITAQALHELIREPALDELEPELVFVDGLDGLGALEHHPDATPIHMAHGSSVRFAHTMRRVPTPDAVPVLALADADTRPVAMMHAMMHGLLPLEVPPMDQSLVASPPKRPLAPRSGRDRLIVPGALLVAVLGVVVFLLMR